MIQFKNVTKSFGNKVVLQHLNFHFPQGKVTGVLGPNSCGKTTLVKLILGFTIPSQGEILIGEKSVLGNSAYRESIGYMPQAALFPENLNPREVFCLLRDLRNNDPSKLDQLISYFGLQGFLNQPFGELSGGTRQKVAAVVAFMFDPKIIILDEPTASLDPVASILLHNLIKREGEAGKTIILISHIISEIESLASEMLFLIDGATRYHGQVSSFKEKSGVQVLDKAILAYFSEPSWV